MSSIRKDQQFPSAETTAVGDAPAQPPAGGEATASPIDKSNVMKSFYQRALEEREDEIERLKQDNQRLRAKIIAGSETSAANDTEAGLEGLGQPQRQTSDLTAQVINNLNAEREKLATELADAKDRTLRTLAELENVRRRTEREKADMSKYAISEFARDVIGVGDNIQRAIDHVPAEAAAGDPTLKIFLEGVQLMERELLSTLERHGVQRLNPDGEKFDPNKHQAVMEKDNAEVPAGTILQVLQAGFTIADRTLRPAVVIVARGGGKLGKPPAAAAETSMPGGAAIIEPDLASDPDGLSG